MTGLDSRGWQGGLASVRFAACYVYSPAGVGAACERSRLLRALVKAGDPRFIGRYAARVQHLAPLAGFVDPRYVWVPVPGSAPAAGGHPSVPDRLATALCGTGLGCGIWRGLYRVRAVRKSGTAMPGSRPSLDAHYDSLAVDSSASMPERVMLIDDVVTKGRTLLAAAARLYDACPNVDVRAFALLRTMGAVRSLRGVLDPCIGEICLRYGDARRSP